MGLKKHNGTKEHIFLCAFMGEAIIYYDNYYKILCSICINDCQIESLPDAVAALEAAVERLGKAHDFRALTSGRQEIYGDLRFGNIKTFNDFSISL